MRYFVNDNCIGCGLCASICSEVFTITDEGVARAIEADIPDEATDLAAEAQESCPVDAIEEA